MKKIRRKKFDRGTEARRVARKSGMAPANTRVIEDKRKRPAKYKKEWLDKEVVGRAGTNQIVWLPTGFARDPAIAD